MDVELVSIRWFGHFQKIATFENTLFFMDVYVVNINGNPSPHSEIIECLWIDSTYKQKGILLGNILERQIMTELVKRDIIS